jgi:alpha-L-arabinofuranosidase
MTSKKVTTKKAQAGSAEDLNAFAHRLAEVFRIARASDLISVRFYNALADAWNDFGNDSMLTDEFWHGEEYIALTLRKAAGR